MNDSTAPPPLPASRVAEETSPPGDPGTVPGKTAGAMEVKREITVATAPAAGETGTGAPDNDNDIPPLPPLPAAEVPTTAEGGGAPPLRNPSGAETDREDGAPTETGGDDVAAAEAPRKPSAVAVAVTKTRKRKRTAKSSSPKRVAKTTLHLRSDVDPALRDAHPRGILHASRPTPDGRGEEHAFAWIAEILDDDDARVAAYLARHGFKEREMRFIPYSSEANWLARYPHARPRVRCNADGEISGWVPRRRDEANGGGAGSGGPKKGSKKKSRGGRRAPPKLLAGGLLPNLERGELHLAIHEYFSWLHAELAEMETSQMGRRQVSLAGVSVPGLQSLVSKIEGTFKSVQLEKEQRERERNARALAMRLEKETRENEMLAAGDLQRPQEQNAEESSTLAQRQEKTTEVPFLEQALEKELQHKAAERLPAESTDTRGAKKRKSGRTSDVSWRALDFATMFQKLAEFKSQKGHASPPVQHPALGRWVSELRLKKKTLRERGLEFEPDATSAGMETEEGSGPTKEVAMQGEEEASAPTQEQQRDAAAVVAEHTPGAAAALSNTHLTQSHVAQLDQLGFAWSVAPARVPWEHRFEELRAFKEREGRFPNNKEGTLGNWLKAQRKLYTKRDSDFMANRCAKLEELGVLLRQRHYTALSWNDRFQQLVEYGRVNRHFKVPNPEKGNGDGQVVQGEDAADARRFYKFVMKIHTEYRALQKGLEVTMLNEERIAQLRSIGFEFSTKPEKTVPDLDWSTRIQQLEAFLSEMGHLRVDPKYDKYSNLGGWAVEMSELHRNWQEGREYLPHDMVEKFNQLSAMGFGFNIFKTRRGERTWDDSFNLLLQYRQETGTCRVPHHYKADFRLGSWVAVQRSEYKLLAEGKPSRMTHEHIQRLVSIGFEWVARRGD